MPYHKEHKATTRRRIVERAARLFRRDGVARVGVRRLMSDAGLTHGGFYAHFPSRGHVLAEAVQTAFEQTRAALEGAMTTAAPEGRLEAFIDAYLDRRHRDHPEIGCAGAALAPEIARDEPAVRQAFDNGIDAVVGLIAAELPAGGEAGERADRARALFALLMGSLQLARAASDPRHSNRILARARVHALELARGR